MKASRLTQRDVEMFARLGIGPSLLDAAGICRVTDAEARQWGIRFSAGADLSGMMIPYVHPLTQHRVTCRLRRDHPEVGTDGKVKDKYLSPQGDNRHLHFLPGARRSLTT